MLNNFILLIYFILFLLSFSSGQNLKELSDSALIEKYSQLVKTDSTNTDAILNLGKIYLYLSDFNNAIKYLKKSIKLNSESPEPYFYLGLIFSETKKNKRAVFYFKKVLEKDKDNLFPDAYYQLGLNYSLLSEYNKAIYYAEKYINLEPRDTLGYKLLGLSYISNNNFRLAINPLKKLIELAPKNPEYYYMLYFAYLHLGNKKKAIVELEKAVELAPYKKTFTGNSYKEELTKYNTNIVISDSFYTQIISDVCRINFPSKPEDRSDLINRVYFYRFFDQKSLVLYSITVSHIGHLKEYNMILKSIYTTRGFLAGWAKRIIGSKKALTDPKIRDYNPFNRGITQRFESLKRYKDGNLKTITDFWIILNQKHKAIIEIYVTRFFLNYDRNTKYVNIFFNSLKIY